MAILFNSPKHALDRLIRRGYVVSYVSPYNSKCITLGGTHAAYNEMVDAEARYYLRRDGWKIKGYYLTLEQIAEQAAKCAQVVPATPNVQTPSI